MTTYAPLSTQLSSGQEIVVNENVGTTQLTLVVPAPPIYEDVPVTFSGKLTGTYNSVVYNLVGVTLKLSFSAGVSTLFYPVTAADGTWSQTVTFPSGGIAPTVTVMLQNELTGGPP